MPLMSLSQARCLKKEMPRSPIREHLACISFRFPKHIEEPSLIRKHLPRVRAHGRPGMHASAHRTEGICPIQMHPPYTLNPNANFKLAMQTSYFILTPYYLSL